MEACGESEVFDRLNQLYINDKEKNSVKYLSDLAGHYAEKAKKGGQWPDFFKAHGLFNACGKREPLEPSWYYKAYDIECYYQQLVSNGVFLRIDRDVHQNTIASIKRLLTDIRTQIKFHMTEEDFPVKYFNSSEVLKERSDEVETQFCQQIKRISERCCKSMVSFVADVMGAAVSFSGEPPCRYAVIALGSMAKCEVTPYSDLEYLFLIEKEDHIVEFERLAVTSFFIINNLKESNLKIYDIEELKDGFSDHTKFGFEIDGISAKAGNIPTGHGPGTPTNNKFIKTVDGFISLYEEILASPNECDLTIADMSAMIASTIFICGDIGLYEEFKCRINEKKPDKQRKLASLKMLQADIKRYNFLPDESLSEIKNVKADFFRFPSIVIYDLKIIWQTKSTIVWDVLEELRGRKSISDSVASSLEFIMCAAQYVRLSTYLLYDSANDRISVLPFVSKNENLAHFPQSLFLKMCLHLIPLKKMIQVKELLLEHFKQDIPKDANIAAAYTYYYINDFSNCIKQFNGQYREVREINDPEQLLMYIKALQSAGKLKEALNCVRDMELLNRLDAKHSTPLKGEVFRSAGMFKESLEVYLKGLELSNDWKTAISVADAYLLLGQMESSFEYYRRALHIPECDPHRIVQGMLLKFYWKNKPHLCKMMLEGNLQNCLHKYGASASHPDIALSYFHLGCLLLNLGEFNQAVRAYKNSVKILKQMYGSASHPHIANSFAHIGNAYARLGNHNQAKKYCNKSIEARRQVFENTSHPDIALSCNDIGSAFCYLGDYKQAIQYYNKSIEIIKQACGNESHPDIASCCSNIGNSYFCLGDYNKALYNYNKSLEIRKQVFGNTSDHDMEDTYNKLGNVYCALGDYTRAMSYYIKFLGFMNKVYPNTHHPDIAHLYGNMGKVFACLGDYENSIKYMSKALEVMKQIFGNDCHPDFVHTSANIGLAYYHLGDYAQSLHHLKKSISLSERMYGSDCHPALAHPYSNIGLVYSDLGDYNQALSYFNKSIEIMKQLVGRTCHPEIARLYNNIGIVYFKLGNFSRALNFYNKSVEIRKQVYGTEIHYDIAESYNNIGSVYSALSDYNQALTYYNKSSQIMKQVFGIKAHPYLVKLFKNIGNAYCNVGDFNQALIHYNKAVELINENVKFANPSTIASLHFCMCKVVYKQGRCFQSLHKCRHLLYFFISHRIVDDELIELILLIANIIRTLCLTSQLIPH